jgi:UDP-glucose:(heptosyl)LPS alpha-1,3-glucosyltransferase
MKLAFCLFNYFPYGGLQRDFLRIAKECVRRGHTVMVYTMKWQGELDSLLPVKILKIRGWQNHTRSKNFVKALQKELAIEQYDRIIGFNKMPGLDVYYAADTCFQAKARAKHGTWYRFLPRYRHLHAFEHAVFAKEHDTTILLIAQNQQAEFMKYYQTTPERFHLLPPGIAKDRIAPPNATEIRAAVRQSFRVAENEFLLLLVGSGFKTKGLDRIIRGMAALSPDLKNRTTLWVAGQDNAAPFQQQVSHLGLSTRINFLGGRDDISKLLLAADVLVHPAYNENTGTVLLEALVSGLPVLTTEVCGYAHYVAEAKAGIVLPTPYQQDQFNHALQDMLLSPDRTTWQQNGIAFAQEADIYQMPERAVEIIESC